MERRRKREPIDRLTLARPTYELVPSFVEMRDAFMELGRTNGISEVRRSRIPIPTLTWT